MESFSVAQSISDFVLSCGDLGIILFIFVTVAIVAAATSIVSSKIKPTGETPAALIEFAETCVVALSDSHITTDEKLKIAEAGAELIKTFKMK